MKTDIEFEVIKHCAKSYNLFIVKLLYREPHIHKDFEVSMVLDDGVTLLLPQNAPQERELHLKKGDVWVMNPFQVHAVRCDSKSHILVIQLSPDFFGQFCIEAQNVRFMQSVIKDGAASVRDALIDVERTFFEKKDFYLLYCAEYIIRLFRLCMAHLPHKVAGEKELSAARTQASRVANITAYIDANFNRKLFLQEVADKEGMSLSRMSHLFTRELGMSFQEYLSRVRCENARLMIMADSTSDLLDVSMFCGFSDIKYFNRAFLSLYKVSPAEYKDSREKFSDKSTYAQKASAIRHPINATVQEFLPPAATLAMLESWSYAE